METPGPLVDPSTVTSPDRASNPSRTPAKNALARPTSGVAAADGAWPADAAIGWTVAPTAVVGIASGAFGGSPALGATGAPSEASSSANATPPVPRARAAASRSGRAD